MEYIKNFNPRPPRGGRQVQHCSDKVSNRFQSTSSARRTTEIYQQPKAYRPISIHVLREEDDEPTAPPTAMLFYFNPRPPRGGRRHGRSEGGRTEYFNPRPPRGGRPRQLRQTAPPEGISIHVLREEDDPLDGGRGCHTAQFQSTSSARRTTVDEGAANDDEKFQSTSSARRTTPAEQLCKR